MIILGCRDLIGLAASVVVDRVAPVGADGLKGRAPTGRRRAESAAAELGATLRAANTARASH